MLGGCGSASPERLPPAAEPPRSPAASVPPSGRVLALGGRPSALAVDPATGLTAVALDRPARLLLLARDGAVVRRVALPGRVRQLAAEPGGGSLLVALEAPSRLLRLSLPGGRRRASVRLPGPPRAIVPLAARRVAVATTDGQLAVVRGDRVVARAPGPREPGGIAALDSGRTLAVVAARERRLELWDVRTLRRTASAPAGVGPTDVACRDDAAGGVCWVVDTAGDALLLFGRADGRLEPTRRQYLPGGPFAIAVDGRRRRLWVAVPGRNQLARLPAAHGTRLLARAATVRQPQAVAVDPVSGDVLVIGTAAGVLQRVRP